MDSETREVHETQNTQIAVIMSELGHIRELIEDIKVQLRGDREQFFPMERGERIEKIVYGGSGLILAGVVASLLALVLK